MSSCAALTVKVSLLSLLRRITQLMVVGGRAIYFAILRRLKLCRNPSRIELRSSRLSLWYDMLRALTKWSGVALRIRDSPVSSCFIDNKL